MKNMVWGSARAEEDEGGVAAELRMVAMPPLAASTLERTKKCESGRGGAGQRRDERALDENRAGAVGDRPHVGDKARRTQDSATTCPGECHMASAINRC